MKKKQVIEKQEKEKEEDHSETTIRLRNEFREKGIEYLKAEFETSSNEERMKDLMNDVINCLDVYDWEHFTLLENILIIKKEMRENRVS